MLLTNEPLKHCTMVLLSINTGMRRGELFGLQWHHINLKRVLLGLNKAGNTSSW